MSVNGKEINKNPNVYYIWFECPDCKKWRWVAQCLYASKSFSGRCRSCANRLISTKFGRWKTSDGYVMVKVDKNSLYYSMAHKTGYVFEHRLKVAEQLGRCLKSSEVVHHVNHIKDDNSDCNLRLESIDDHNIISLLELKVIRLESEIERLKIGL